jgi:hypothetical protein
VRQQLLDAIYAGHPFRTVLRDLDLTSNQVFGLTRTDDEWSTKLEAALTASRREDLEHGTDAAYITAVFAATAGRISRFGGAGAVAETAQSTPKSLTGPSSIAD